MWGRSVKGLADGEYFNIGGSPVTIIGPTGRPVSRSSLQAYKKQIREIVEADRDRFPALNKAFAWMQEYTLNLRRGSDLCRAPP